MEQPLEHWKGDCQTGRKLAACKMRPTWEAPSHVHERSMRIKKICGTRGVAKTGGENLRQQGSGRQGTACTLSTNKAAPPP
eukprot:357835-Chlamydomonas_euryale.AAC.4